MTAVVYQIEKTGSPVAAFCDAPDHRFVTGSGPGRAGPAEGSALSESGAKSTLFRGCFPLRGVPLWPALSLYVSIQHPLKVETIPPRTLNRYRHFHYAAGSSIKSPAAKGGGAAGG